MDARVTWQVPDVDTAQEPQGVFVVGRVVPDRLVVFAGQVVETAVNGRHARQVVQHVLHGLDRLLRTGSKGAFP